MATATVNDVQAQSNGIVKARPKARAEKAKRDSNRNGKVSKAKPAKRSGNGHRNDGCEQLAKTSDGKLNTVQVRMLQILVNGKSLTRKDLKEKTGHWLHRPGQYHRDWVNALRELSPKLVKAVEDEKEGGGTCFFYSITAAGKELLAKCKAVAK